MMKKFWFWLAIITLGLVACSSPETPAQSSEILPPAEATAPAGNAVFSTSSYPTATVTLVLHLPERLTTVALHERIDPFRDALVSGE